MAKKPAKKNEPKLCDKCACVGCSEGNCCGIYKTHRNAWDRLADANQHTMWAQEVFKRKLKKISSIKAAVSNYNEFGSKDEYGWSAMALLEVVDMALGDVMNLTKWESDQVYNDPKCVACRCETCQEGIKAMGKDLDRQLWIDERLKYPCCGHEDIAKNRSFDDLPF